MPTCGQPVGHGPCDKLASLFLSLIAVATIRRELSALVGLLWEYEVMLVMDNNGNMVYRN